MGGGYYSFVRILFNQIILLYQILVYQILIILCMHNKPCNHKGLVVNTSSLMVNQEGNVIPTGEVDNARKCIRCGSIFHPITKDCIPLNSIDDDMS